MAAEALQPASTATSFCPPPPDFPEISSGDIRRNLAAAGFFPFAPCFAVELLVTHTVREERWTATMPNRRSMN